MAISIAISERESATSFASWFDRLRPFAQGSKYLLNLLIQVVQLVEHVLVPLVQLLENITGARIVHLGELARHGFR